MNANYDVCIVGAGVSGASLAAYLSKQNLKIALIDFCFEERDRIVGELLQPGGVYMLNQLGIDDVLDNIETSPISGYTIINNDQSVKIDYNDDGDFKGIKGRGLNNGKFIQALRHKTSDLPNVDQIKGKVIDFVEVENHVEGVVLEKEDNKSVILSKLTVVCDGFFSGLRNKLIASEKKITSYFAGLLLENCQLPNEGYGHIFMGGKAPFLCYRVGKKKIRLLVDFPGSKAPVKGMLLDQYLLYEVMPQLPLEMQKSLQIAMKKGAYKFMPNHLMNAVACTKSGIAMVGDSLNMRHPLTGGGMTAALTDVKLLANAILQNGNLHEQEQLCINIPKYYKERNDWNASINLLADALYRVTLNPELKQACFNYLAKDAENCRQPIDLLSGISRDNSILFKHFIQVAFTGAKDQVFNEFAYKNLDISLSILFNASQILFPLVMKENIQIRNFISDRTIVKLASA